MWSECNFTLSSTSDIASVQKWKAQILPSYFFKIWIRSSCLCFYSDEALNMAVPDSVMSLYSRFCSKLLSVRPQPIFELMLRSSLTKYLLSLCSTWSSTHWLLRYWLNFLLLFCPLGWYLAMVVKPWIYTVTAYWSVIYFIFSTTNSCSVSWMHSLIVWSI